MGKTPKIPTPVTIPPPPTPASFSGAMSGGMKPGAAGSVKPNLGGTFLTASMPGAVPLTKPKKAVGGY